MVFGRYKKSSLDQIRLMHVSLSKQKPMAQHCCCVVMCWNSHMCHFKIGDIYWHKKKGMWKWIWNWEFIMLSKVSKVSSCMDFLGLKIMFQVLTFWNLFFSNFPNNLILINDHNQSYRVEKDIKTLQLITFSFDIIYGLKIYYFKVLTLLKFKIFKWPREKWKKTHVVDIEELYNFVVDSFFSCNHLSK